MKRLLLGAVASLVLAATGFAGASAQGSVTTDWSGLYIGANGTFQSNNATYTFTGNSTACPSIGCAGTADGVLAPGSNNTSFSQHGNGNGYGGQVGFNAQRGRFVFGVDAVFNQNNLVIDSINNAGVNVYGYNVDYQTSLKSTSAATVRIGVANNSTLYYVKGGAALGRFTSNINTQGFSPSVGSPASFNQTHTTGGYTYGAGADWAFDPNNRNVLAGIEYDYYKFNNVAFGGTINPNNTFPVAYTLSNLNLSTVQVRLSYKLR